MNIDLKEFIGSCVVPREVSFKGKTRTFHFRELSAKSAEDLFLGVNTEDKVQKGLRAKIIANIMCDEEGSDLFTIEQANELPNALATTLQEISFDVNGLNPKEDEEEKK